MPTGYDNDKDNEGNSHDEDVDSTDFKANWKIYLIFFSSGGRGSRMVVEIRGLRAEENQDPCETYPVDFISLSKALRCESYPIWK